jgi:hypothetical protein
VNRLNDDMLMATRLILGQIGDFENYVLDTIPGVHPRGVIFREQAETLNGMGQVLAVRAAQLLDRAKKMVEGAEVCRFDDESVGPLMAEDPRLCPPGTAVREDK